MFEHVVNLFSIRISLFGIPSVSKIFENEPPEPNDANKSSNDASHDPIEPLYDLKLFLKIFADEILIIKTKEKRYQYYWFLLIIFCSAQELGKAIAWFIYPSG